MSANCEILDLRAFKAVVELANFHRAAEALNISQPALSRRIQKLEATIGAPLLERTTRQVHLTALGNELVPMVDRMLEEFDSSLFSSKSLLPSSRQMLLPIACLPTIAYSMMPRAIERFREVYPRVRFRILDVRSVDVCQAVARGDVEFGLNLGAVSELGLEFMPLLSDPFDLVMNRAHPLAEINELVWEHLQDYPLIANHRLSGNRAFLDSTLARSKLAMNWSYEVTKFSTALGMIEVGLGVSVMPRSTLPKGCHTNLVVRPIGGPTIARTIGILRRSGSSMSKTARDFHDLIVEMYQTPSAST